MIDFLAYLTIFLALALGTAVVTVILWAYVVAVKCAASRAQARILIMERKKDDDGQG